MTAANNEDVAVRVCSRPSCSGGGCGGACVRCAKAAAACFASVSSGRAASQEEACCELPAIQRRGRRAPHRDAGCCCRERAGENAARCAVRRRVAELPSMVAAVSAMFRKPGHHRRGESVDSVASVESWHTAPCDDLHVHDAEQHERDTEAARPGGAGSASAPSAGLAGLSGPDDPERDTKLLPDRGDGMSVEKRLAAIAAMRQLIMADPLTGAHAPRPPRRSQAGCPATTTLGAWRDRRTRPTRRLPRPRPRGRRPDVREARVPIKHDAGALPPRARRPRQGASVGG